MEDAGGRDDQIVLPYLLTAFTPASSIPHPASSYVVSFRRHQSPKRGDNCDAANSSRA
jgi:hypothetical protein